MQDMSSDFNMHVHSGMLSDALESADMLHLHISVYEALFLVVWVVIGSILGFFSFGYRKGMTFIEMFGECTRSVFLGFVLSFPLVHYLIEEHYFSTHTAILIGGVGGLGLPDMFIKYYPYVQRLFARKVLSRYDRTDKNAE